MRQLLILILVGGALSCGEQKSKRPQRDAVSTTMEKDRETYPEDLSKVLKAHGGLETWRQMKTIQFEIPKASLREKHTVDLYSRKDKILMDGVQMGFDGQDVWLLDPSGTYQGDAGFYHNLMFYFYAMPFVIADPGIQYGTAPDLRFNGKSYPGIAISYEAGVGTSPKDEYYLHYDPDSYQMSWLGYTVTYGSNEKSDNVKWIRYKDWKSINGVLLPQALTWYTLVSGKPGEPRNTVNFENIDLRKNSLPEAFFQKPGNAKTIEVPE